ncbi:hypothetical protein FACS189437_02040 [Bacteroidia bacterium]|nr:hypothetical protein FACS189437_02040 [Bacteroidia bacterium]
MAGFMQECSGHYTRDCYVLKLDIRGYFMSINKNLLWEKLLQMLELLTTEQIPGMDKESLLWLINLVLWNDPTQFCIVKGKNTGHYEALQNLPDSEKAAAG